jgi:COMPASS component SWD3
MFRSCAGFTPSSTYLFSSTLSSILRIYDIHTSKVLKTFRHASYVSERHPCPAIIFERPRISNEQLVNGNVNANPDRQSAEAWLISGSENGKVVIWDVKSRNVVAILEGHDRPVVALAVSPNGRRIASGSLEPEKTIRTWEVGPADET